MSEQELADIWRDLDRSVNHLRDYILRGDQASAQEVLGEIEHAARVGWIELEMNRNKENKE